MTDKQIIDKNLSEDIVICGLGGLIDCHIFKNFSNGA